MTQGWRLGKAAAEKLMEKGNFTVEDVRNALTTLRTFEEECPDASERLEEALQQMKLMRQGKLPKITWDEFTKEMAKSITQSEDGTIILDPNNPYHVAWFELDEDEEDEED